MPPPISVHTSAIVCLLKLLHLTSLQKGKSVGWRVSDYRGCIDPFLKEG